MLPHRERAVVYLDRALRDRAESRDRVGAGLPPFHESDDRLAHRRRLSAPLHDSSAIPAKARDPEEPIL